MRSISDHVHSAFPAILPGRQFQERADPSPRSLGASTAARRRGLRDGDVFESQIDTRRGGTRGPAGVDQVVGAVGIDVVAGQRDALEELASPVNSVTGRQSGPGEIWVVR